MKQHKIQCTDPRVYATWGRSVEEKTWISVWTVEVHPYSLHPQQQRTNRSKHKYRQHGYQALNGSQIPGCHIWSTATLQIPHTASCQERHQCGISAKSYRKLQLGSPTQTHPSALSVKHEWVQMNDFLSLSQLNVSWWRCTNLYTLMQVHWMYFFLPPESMSLTKTRLLRGRPTSQPE